jgi:RNA polymerase sigma-70 factor, ECF subfamily
MLTELLDPHLLRERDSETWDALYMSTCRRTYRVLSHVTGASRLVLDDLNQDVWLSALESIEGFDATRGTAQDWILGIARFKGLNYLRKKYSSRLAYVGDCSALHEQPEVSASAEAAECAAVLRGSIESLPENWQFVLKQKYHAGMSVKEIAELAETTPKAIESTLSRARQRLRELFQDTFLRGTE